MSSSKVLNGKPNLLTDKFTLPNLMTDKLITFVSRAAYVCTCSYAMNNRVCHFVFLQYRKCRIHSRFYVDIGYVKHKRALRRIL